MSFALFRPSYFIIPAKQKNQNIKITPSTPQEGKQHLGGRTIYNLLSLGKGQPLSAWETSPHPSLHLLLTQVRIKEKVGRRVRDLVESPLSVNILSTLPLFLPPFSPFIPQGWKGNSSPDKSSLKWDIRQPCSNLCIPPNTVLYRDGL